MNCWEICWIIADYHVSCILGVKLDEVKVRMTEKLHWHRTSWSEATPEEAQQRRMASGCGRMCLWHGMNSGRDTGQHGMNSGRDTGHMLTHVLRGMSSGCGRMCLWHGMNSGRDTGQHGMNSGRDTGHMLTHVLGIQSTRTQSQLVPSQLVPTVNSYPSQRVPKVNSYPNAKETQSNVIIILVIITA